MSPRVWMRAPLTAPLPGDGDGARPFDINDLDALAPLMLRAYRGTVDDEGETVEQAAAALRSTAEGAYGDFLPGCSRVIERGGALRSAALITRQKGRPLVAFTFTDPDFAGQGLAGACMASAMAALFAQGERELSLVVTLANTPARRLYARLGFVLDAG